mmetsp:Transcript_36976/g.52241  ORF Transcript_36976/g.52241 Transcript_36976/m.52241 type:complete len:201 (-) Transcript_36976:496-1098(-)
MVPLSKTTLPYLLLPNSKILNSMEPLVTLMSILTPKAASNGATKRSHKFFYPIWKLSNLWSNFVTILFILKTNTASNGATQHSHIFCPIRQFSTRWSQLITLIFISKTEAASNATNQCSCKSICPIQRFSNQLPISTTTTISNGVNLHNNAPTDPSIQLKIYQHNGTPSILSILIHSKVRKCILQNQIISSTNYPIFKLI